MTDCSPPEWSRQGLGRSRGVSPRWRPLGAYGRVPQSQSDILTATPLQWLQHPSIKAALIPAYGRGGAAFQGGRVPLRGCRCARCIVDGVRMENGK